MSETEQHDLIRRASAGDRDAMSDLLTSQQDRVYALCLRLLGNRNDAEDLTQDVLTSIITHLDQFDGRSALTTWVYRISVNACMSHLRQKQRTQAAISGDTGLRVAGTDYARSEGSPGQPHQDVEPAADSSVELSERREQLLASINMMDVSIRTLLILRDFHGLDYNQISQVLNIPRGTVKSRMFRARMALRRQMDRFTIRDEDGDFEERTPGNPIPGKPATDEQQSEADSPTAHS